MKRKEKKNAEVPILNQNQRQSFVQSSTLALPTSPCHSRTTIIRLRRKHLRWHCFAGCRPGAARSCWLGWRDGFGTLLWHIKLLVFFIAIVRWSLLASRSLWRRLGDRFWRFLLRGWRRGCSSLASGGSRCCRASRDRRGCRHRGGRGSRSSNRWWRGLFLCCCSSDGFGGDRFCGGKCAIEEVDKFHTAFAGGDAIDATLET